MNNTTLLLPASIRLDSLIRGSHALIDEAVKTYKITSLWAAFSGGHDSLTATHVASLHPLFKGIVHIDTGTGLKETRQFVEDVCSRYGWQMIVKKPATTYEMLLVRYGFPGPHMHQEMYKYLKERPLRQARTAARKLDGNKKPTLALISGMRSQESKRREKNTQPMDKGKEGIWISVIHNWAALDCSDYIKAFNLPRSEVKAKMHMSGECYCGSFARPGELKELEFWYPYQAERIKAWQELVATTNRLGLASIPEKHCQWGHGGKPSGDAPQQVGKMCYNCRAHA
jgi:3'-phosphoadenosine 5'-phosphosulfate sulfotransferase (PAPS reductase)/FAD synthetase